MLEAPIKSKTCKKHGLYFYHPNLTRQFLNLYCDNCHHLVSSYEDGACVCCGKAVTPGVVR